MPRLLLSKGIRVFRHSAYYISSNELSTYLHGEYAGSLSPLMPNSGRRAPCAQPRAAQRGTRELFRRVHVGRALATAALALKGFSLVFSHVVSRRKLTEPIKSCPLAFAWEIINECVNDLFVTFQRKIRVSSLRCLQSVAVIAGRPSRWQ